MGVPRFLDRVSESDLTFFNPGDVVDLLAAHGCRDQIGPYLRRRNGGLQSTGTIRTDGSAILAAARRHLAVEAETSHTITVGLVDALHRVESSHLLAESLPGFGEVGDVDACSTNASLKTGLHDQATSSARTSMAPA